MLLESMKTRVKRLQDHYDFEYHLTTFGRKASTTLRIGGKAVILGYFHQHHAAYDHALGYVTDGERFLFIDGGGNHTTRYDRRAIRAERLFRRNIQQQHGTCAAIVLLIFHAFVAGMSIDEIITLFRDLTTDTFHRVIVHYIKEHKLPVDMRDDTEPPLNDDSRMVYAAIEAVIGAPTKRGRKPQPHN